MAGGQSAEVVEGEGELTTSHTSHGFNGCWLGFFSPLPRTFFFFIAFRETGRKTGRQIERNVDVHPQAASCLHLDRGSNPQPMYVP